MKKLFLFLLLFTGLTTFAQEAEKEAIKTTIHTAYVDGIQNRGEIADIDKGFHPGFNLLGIDRNNHLSKLPIYTWVDYVKSAKEKDEEKGAEVSAKYPMIDVSGKAAVAKVELYKKGEKIFTDYLSLYKFEEGWRIVSKIYHRH